MGSRKSDLPSRAEVKATRSAGCSRMASVQDLRPRTSLILRYIYPNAYLNYITEFLRNPHNRNTGLRQTRLFKVAAQQWRCMTEEERRPYREAAEYNKRQLAVERSKNPPVRRKKVRMICSKCGHRQSRKRKSKPKEVKKEMKRATSKRKPCTDHDLEFGGNSSPISSVSSF